MAIPIVLLDRPLTVDLMKEKILQVKVSIDTHQEVRLLIDSPGGQTIEALEMYDLISSSPKSSVHIVNAASAAAFIALAAQERTMERTGTFFLHGGSINVEAIDLNADQFVTNSGLVANVKVFQERLWKVVAEKIPLLSDDEKMQLLMSNWLRLTAAQCLEYGIVQSLI